MGKKMRKKRTSFRFADFLVVVLCLSIVVFALNLFRLDLFQTLSLQNEKPVGTITIKNNIVQRRLIDRVLWDRLAVESPVYLGDLIRVAELSSATLNLERQQIDLNENTLIRIQLSPEGESLQIELSEGNLGIITSSEGKNLQLSLMGRIVEPTSGTTLTATAGKEGIAVQVNEGAAAFIEDGKSRKISSGAMIALDEKGAELKDPAVVVTQPRPNARYVKGTEQPVPVVFAWSRINLRPQDTMLLEIAADKSFSRNVVAVGDLNASAEIALEAGLWNWRLSHEKRILSAGTLTVVEALGLELLSPARGSLFRYKEEQPSLAFQWTEIKDASHYIIEISSSPDFAGLQINKEIAAPFFVDSGLGQGTWHWRVQPMFSSAFEGNAVFSQASFFLIGQSADGDTSTAMIEPETSAVPPEPILLSPAHGARLPGLTALREKTIFTWDVDGEVKSSRFVLSQSSNPLTGTPAVEIIDPRQTISLDRLEEGVWYWTIETQSVNGLVNAAQPRELRIQPIPLLVAPGNRRPPERHLFNIEQLRTQRNIVFSWSPVQGANAYIFTLFEQTAAGRRQINRATVTSTSWTLENISVLDRGTFIWQVEAINRNNSNTIEQRGSLGINSFTIDIPAPRPVHMEDPGVLYGF